MLSLLWISSMRSTAAAWLSQKSFVASCPLIFIISLTRSSHNGARWADVRDVMPPQMRPRSTTMTDLPRLQSSYAVEIPATPEPMTATSHSWTPSSTFAPGATSISIHSDLLVIERSPRQLRTLPILAKFQPSLNSEGGRASAAGLWHFGGHEHRCRY